ncbi:MAG: hypothetical protein H6Q19_34 [Bacteroidetes bacterium]|nr:hypothetical protein [Bacteroidota bacterium]
MDLLYKVFLNKICIRVQISTKLKPDIPYSELI